MANTSRLILAGILAAASTQALDIDRLGIQRKNIFEFTQKPAATVDGDNVTITFAAKDYCDATVAIENDRGRILRHLASGVLGKNAPDPFQKNSLEQTVAWDGKDELGEYVIKKERCRVRVSLGLKPRFERTLYWYPGMRWCVTDPPLMATSPEGIYVFDEYYGASFVRLFDHEGDYIRTVYPFPADRLEQVKGLRWRTFPQDGKRFPLKNRLEQNSLLTSADLRYTGEWPHDNRTGRPAATAMAVRGKWVFLVSERLNRFTTGGDTGGLSMNGPKTCIEVGKGRRAARWCATSAAASPDCRWLYLAGVGLRPDMKQAVYRMNPLGDKEPVIFVGDPERGGEDKDHFKYPTSVACDASGRVYVTDFGNDRVQVFSETGTLLKSIPFQRPIHVSIDGKTGDVYVFSWRLQFDRFYRLPTLVDLRKTNPRRGSVARFAALPDKLDADTPIKPAAAYPLEPYRGIYGKLSVAEVASRGGKPVMWIAMNNWQSDGGTGRGHQALHRTWGIKVFGMDGRKLKLQRDFQKEALELTRRTKPPKHLKQRLYFNPARERLYVTEGQPNWGQGEEYGFNQLVEIDPETGKTTLVKLPCGAEDMAFDLRGHAYLRTAQMILRFDTSGPRWHEVPWDYGEERGSAHFFGPSTRALSGIVAPTKVHPGGFWVTARGRVAAACIYKYAAATAKSAKQVHDVRRYLPPIYPGRFLYMVINIWDRHGKLVLDDALPGVGQLSGTMLDAHDNLYVVSTSQGMYGEKPYFNDTSCTLIKAQAGKARIVSKSGGRIPLPRESWPDRPADLGGLAAGPKGWVEGADWIFGGCGLDTQSKDRPERNCHCTGTFRAALDYFARSFVPEPDRFDIAVLDTAGNVITRIGRYGNVDDGTPLVPDGGSANPRPLGGDEVALMHGTYVAVHSDRRLFIADPGNARIASVRLGYHTTETTMLDR